VDKCSSQLTDGTNAVFLCFTFHTMTSQDFYLINTFIVQDVYKNISSTVLGVVQGLNVTVFAYGSTGRYAFTAIRRLFIFIHHQICTPSHSQYSTISYIAVINVVCISE
jgi:hypothetical protein